VTAIRFPGEKGKSQKLAVFALNQWNREFESISLRQRASKSPAGTWSCGNMGSWAAKELAKRFAGDLSSADWRHFGRLAGFTNQKPERPLPNGLAPFVRLRQCEGRIYDAAHEFLEEVESLAEKAVAERAPRATSRSTSNENSVRPLAEFHGNPRYGGDIHRADMAWAVHAASAGLSEQQIRE
jgi:hypothetical protein